MIFPFPLRENRKLLPLQKLELQFNLPPISALQATDIKKGGINFGFFKQSLKLWLSIQRTNWGAYSPKISLVLVCHSQMKLEQVRHNQSMSEFNQWKVVLSFFSNRSLEKCFFLKCASRSQTFSTSMGAGRLEMASMLDCRHICFLSIGLPLHPPSFLIWALKLCVFPVRWHL